MKFIRHEVGEFEYFGKKWLFQRELSFKRNSQFYREAYQFVIESNFEILLTFLTLTFIPRLVSKHSNLQTTFVSVIND